MKDLDFDELDRAVSTLMGNVTNAAEPAKQDDVKTISITASLTDNTPPVFPVGEASQPRSDISTQAAPQVVAPAPEVQSRPAPLAARRSGKFMDMVHPSATARKATPSQGISRQGVSLSPVSSEADAPTAPSKDIEQVPVAASTTPEPVDIETSSDWPDPLSLEQPVEAVDDQSAPEVMMDILEPTEPLVSPFLADAKVEKRPLGAPVALQASVVPEPEAVPVVETPQEEDTAAEPISITEEAPEVELPEELRGDLMAIEADTSDASASAPAPVSSVVELPAEEPVATSPVSVAATAPAAATAPLAASLAGPVSIPQQYREEPSTGDQTTGSIYDTASYHQPLEHPAKKKTGWLWVIWVLVLLILGAGGGALAYLYLLQ